MAKNSSVCIDLSTKEKLDYLIKSTGQTKKELLKILINELFEICYSVTPCVGTSKVLMTCNSSVLASTVTIEFLGQSKILTGHFETDAPNSEINKEVKEKLENQIDSQNAVQIDSEEKKTEISEEWKKRMDS